MQIICPSCEATYAVPDVKLAGREVRCARCGTQWTPLPAPQPESLPEPKPEPMAAVSSTFAAPSPEPQPFFAAIAPAAPKTRAKGLAAAWIASVVLLIAIAIGAYASRDGIMQAWPPSQRVYGAFGLH